jgi:alanyl-tRNA synthetase
MDEIKSKNKEIDQLKSEKLSNSDSNFTSEKIGNINLIHHIFKDINPKDFRNLATKIASKKEYKLQSVIAFFAENNEKITVIIAISDDLTVNFKAGDLIKDVIVKIDGKGGGGRSNFAMGGGSNKNGILDAIATLKESLSLSSDSLT